MTWRGRGAELLLLDLRRPDGGRRGRDRAARRRFLPASVPGPYDAISPHHTRSWGPARLQGRTVRASSARPEVPGELSSRSTNASGRVSQVRLALPARARPSGGRFRVPHRARPAARPGSACPRRRPEAAPPALAPQGEPRPPDVRAPRSARSGEWPRASTRGRSCWIRCPRVAGVAAARPATARSEKAGRRTRRAALVRLPEPARRPLRRLQRRLPVGGRGAAGGAAPGVAISARSCPSARGPRVPPGRASPSSSTPASRAASSSVELAAARAASSSCRSAVPGMFMRASLPRPSTSCAGTIASAPREASASRDQRPVRLARGSPAAAESPSRARRRRRRSPPAARRVVVVRARVDDLALARGSRGGAGRRRRRGRRRTAARPSPGRPSSSRSRVDRAA